MPTNVRAERIRLLTEAARRTVLDPSYSLLLGQALWTAAGRTADATHAYAIAVAIDRQLIARAVPRGDPRQAVEVAG